MLYAKRDHFLPLFYSGRCNTIEGDGDNLKKSGAFVPGIRPGSKTAKYLRRSS